MSGYILHISIQTFWHSGTGRHLGAAGDAATHRDALDLPTLPGRHIKGLLRDALEHAARWCWPGHSLALTRALFGDRTEHAPAGLEPQASALRISDARLPDEVISWLGRDDPSARRLRGGLFRIIQSIALDAESGARKTCSERGIEVVVPLDLTARIESLPGRQPPADWPNRMREVLPLISAVGAHRNRGLGRALLNLEAAR